MAEQNPNTGTTSNITTLIQARLAETKKTSEEKGKRFIILLTPEGEKALNKLNKAMGGNKKISLASDLLNMALEEAAAQVPG